MDCIAAMLLPAQHLLLQDTEIGRDDPEATDIVYRSLNIRFGELRGFLYLTLIR